MALKKALNDALIRTAGYRLQKIDKVALARRKGKRREGDRLLQRPTFILCSVRSGSTLMRVLLNSHSQIHCPHELHLRNIKVDVGEGYPQKALRASRLDATRLEYLLWDRLLHRELTRSRKDIIVNKTPSDAFIADRIVECWPDARFIYMLRHPGAIARSRHSARPQDPVAGNARMVARYCDAVEKARQTYPGLDVRYEELASDPAAVTREVCEFLGVRWEREMLDYGEFSHGKFRVGLGDWSDKIKSGRVQPPAPPPPLEEIPPRLLKLCRAWGYLEPEESAGGSVAPARESA